MYGDDSDDDGDEKEYVDEHADKNADLGSTRYEKSPETVSVLRCARKDGNDCVDDDDDDGGGGIPQRLCGRDDAEDPATDPMVLIPTGDVCFMNRVDPELDEARGF